MLVVEDQLEMQEFIEQEALARGLPLELEFAGSRERAASMLDSGTYDLVVCDLRIPPTDGSVDAEESHGLAVHALVRDRYAGTPVIFLTGYATVQNMKDALSNGPTADLFGAEVMAVVDAYEKDRPRDFFDRLELFEREFAALSGVEIETLGGSPSLPPMVDRSLQIYARRRGAVRVHVRRLDGLSGAAVIHATFFDRAGREVCRTFAKVGERAKMVDEQARYREHVQGVLDLHRFAPDAGTVLHNLRDCGALFYSLADGYGISLFDALSDVALPADRIVESVRAALGPWNQRRTATGLKVGDLRRRFLPDRRVEELGLDLGFAGGFETVRIVGDESIQHGDLHGGNVLLNAELRTLLVDFGDVAVLPVAIDAVTLEFSVVFHASGPFRGSGWPSVEQAERWWDTEAYIVGCPAPEFIRACRTWLGDLENADVDAVVYAHACRQLKYPDVPRELAFSVARGAVEHARASRR